MVRTRVAAIGCFILYVYVEITAEVYAACIRLTIESRLQSGVGTPVSRYEATAHVLYVQVCEIHVQGHSMTVSGHLGELWKHRGLAEHHGAFIAVQASGTKKEAVRQLIEVV